MKLKNIWLIFCLVFLILVPVKIYSAISPIEFVESSTFLIIFGVAATALALLAFFSKISIKNVSLTRNIWSGILAAVISLCFFWCVPAYFNDTVTKYDAEWHPILLSVFSGLSCISFLLMAITHFSGKNVLAKAPFFIYCPLFWFGTKMILFLSMNINETDPYVVFSTGLLTLFMLYYTQTFATSTKTNNVKVLFVFGLPLLMLGFCPTIPILLQTWTGTVFAHSTIATACVVLLLSVYVLATLLTAYKQSESEQKVIKEFQL